MTMRRVAMKTTIQCVTLRSDIYVRSVIVKSMVVRKVDVGSYLFYMLLCTH